MPTNELDFLDEMARFLQVKNVGTAGTDIFTNKQPDSPVNSVSLLPLIGPIIGSQRDVPDLHFPRFQAVVRNEDYNNGADKLEQVRETLHGIVGLTLPVSADVTTDPYIRVMRCHADQEGGPIGEDEQGRSEFTINFSAEYHFYAQAA